MAPCRMGGGRFGRDAIASRAGDSRRHGQLVRHITGRCHGVIGDRHLRIVYARHSARGVDGKGEITQCFGFAVANMDVIGNVSESGIECVDRIADGNCLAICVAAARR